MNLHSLTSIAAELVCSFWVIQSAFALFLIRMAHRLYSAQRERQKEGVKTGETRRVALIIAAKGVSKNFIRFMDFALGQDYPDYRVIFTVESQRDPAYEAIRERIFGLDHATIIVAGEAVSCGQKVHNQLAAFKLLEEHDRIVAFADGDLVSGNDWLSSLCFPLNKGFADLTTGYRWFIPENQRLPNRIIALIGAAIEPLLGPGWRMCLWGGSLAMTRESFEGLKLPQNLEGSVNDDVRITQLAKRAGLRMRYTRTVAALTPVDFTWASLVEFGRRQYFQVRIYQPFIWLRALLITLMHLVSFSICLVRLIQGDLLMLNYFGAAFILNAIRTKMRRQYLKERFPDGGAEALDHAVKSGWWMDSLVYAVHLIIVFSAACGRKMNWAGIQYHVTGPQQTEIIRASRY